MPVGFKGQLGPVASDVRLRGISCESARWSLLRTHEDAVVGGRRDNNTRILQVIFVLVAHRMLYLRHVFVYNVVFFRILVSVLAENTICHFLVIQTLFLAVAAWTEVQRYGR